MALTAQRTPRAEVLKHAEELYQERFPDGPPAEAPANVGTMLLLAGADVLEMTYKGTLYELGHVSFEDGLELTRAREALEQLEEAVTEANVRAYALAAQRVVDMAPKYLFPVHGRFRRLRWRLRLRRNPFRDATDAEVGLLLGFFLRCRMRSRVGSRPPSGARRELISLTSGTSTGSRTGNGRARGSTSFTGSPT